MKLEKCQNSTIIGTPCKTPEEIDDFINNLILTRHLMQPMIDSEYMHENINDVLPFNITDFIFERHLLSND